MKPKLPAVSQIYRKKLTAAVVSTVFFFIFYFFLILFALALIGLLGYLAVQLLTLKFSYFTGVLGLALIGTGLTVFYYLIKFVFSSKTASDTGLVEISEKDQPEMFQVIREIVKSTGTAMPKKVFISPEVNASVSYNSVFLSMFLPIRKNLTIGLGLINTVTIGELRAVLAHEFGHFSQKSMAVASYVYQAEKIIYDTVYNNRNFEQNLVKEDRHWAIKLAALIALVIIRGIQFLLKLCSDFLFKNHASLRREMEFHADAVSTFVTNPQEQVSSLLRLDISETALQRAVTFYSESDGAYQTKNLYENQTSLLFLLAEEHLHKIENGLPKIEIQEVSRHHYGRISIEDAFASHPEILQRVAKISQNLSQNIAPNHEPARSLLRSYEKIAEKITAQLFMENSHINAAEFIDGEEFINLYREKYSHFAFDKRYRGYYDRHHPVLPLEPPAGNDFPLAFDGLFSEEKVALNYKVAALENDLLLLNFLSSKPSGIKTFRNGETLCRVSEAKKLIPKFQKELAALENEVRQNDVLIFSYFWKKGDEAQKARLEALYLRMKLAFEEFDTFQEAINNFSSTLAFMTEVHPAEEIRKRRATLWHAQELYKEKLYDFIEKSDFSGSISQTQKEDFEKYIASEFIFFEHNEYKYEEVEEVFRINSAFQQALSEAFFAIKKELLDFQLEIENA